eukprot:7698302-Pyramimonas_sp.AAC.1
MPPKPGSGRKPGSKGKDKGGELETDAFAHLDKYPLVPLMVISSNEYNIRSKSTQSETQISCASA